MKRTTSFLVRVALMAAALALAVVFVGRGDSPAEATSYNPSFNVSVSDPTPGAAADVVISFSVDAPDAFPNVRTDSSIQFIPRQWGIHTPPPIGGIAGTFNALTTLGIMGTNPCIYAIPVPFTMMDASTDTSRTTSALDIGGDAHPGGLGYSGQFAADPDTVQPPTDLGLPLIGFNANEKHTSIEIATDPDFQAYGYYVDNAYRDMDGSNNVSVGDIRLIQYLTVGTVPDPSLGPGTVVQPGDPDLGFNDALWPFKANEKHVDPNNNGQMDPEEQGIYRDKDWSGTVTYGDIRLFEFAHLELNSVVELFQLPGGVNRYPDFLNQMFPPEVVGEPLARMFGAQNVLNTTMVSLSIVTYRPGQLPGYPATLGYPNVVVLLDPVAPIEVISITTTSDLCTPLALVSTNLGVSQDNPATQANEAGYVRLTNPKAEKSHDFTLVTTSQPDADNDGTENMLDSCPLTPNTQDLDGRNNGESWPYAAADPDKDGLDGACDPDPNNRSRGGTVPGISTGLPDEDGDGYINRADNCPTVANGVGLLSMAMQQVPGFTFYWANTGDVIGPDNQKDTDGDDIGDACEGSEHGAQCLNDVDDDDDGVVNDGCPMNPSDSWPVAESGAQCDNALDDDDDGYVNDGCPQVSMNGQPEVGDQCLNATDDDGDGKVNDGCPETTGSPESGDQCLNNTDDDDDGKVNDGCPANGTAESGWRCNDALDNEPNWQGGPDGYVNDGCPVNGAGAETGWLCNNAVDDDGDGVVNDGCPVNVIGSETGDQCANAIDDDDDGLVNDGCPPKQYFGTPETGDQCNNAIDDDDDGLVNDGCPAVDPGDVAKNTITGHMHVVTLTQGVPIFKHGVKLNTLGGPKKVQDGGARTYNVDVSNLSGSDPVNAQVALQVVEGCATVNGEVDSQDEAVVTLAPGDSGTADFTVDWTGCEPGEYTVRADACQGGDKAPAGFFGSGDCPGDPGWGTPTSGAVPLASATASSEAFGPEYAAAKAIDGFDSTLWCTMFEPGTYIEASLASPASVDQVNIRDSYGGMGYAFASGTLSFSTGYSQDVTLTDGAGSFSVPAQDGAEWVRFTATADAGSGVGCISELQVNGSWLKALPDPDPLDDAPWHKTVTVGP